MHLQRAWLSIDGHFLRVLEGLWPGLYLCRAQSPTGQVHWERVLVP